MRVESASRTDSVERLEQRLYVCNHRLPLPVSRVFGPSSPGSDAGAEGSSPPRPSFYALAAGGWRDLVTVLHPPYTAWHLSNVAIGAALSPTFAFWRLGAALAAFFLGLGIGAHALDELAGRPLGTHLSRAALISLAAIGLGGAIAIGLVGVVIVSVWLLPLIAACTFLALAYNLELFGGRFHTTFWLVFAWAGLPTFTGWFVEAKDVRPEPILVAIACCLFIVAQRRLSTPARELRRRTSSLAGQRTLRDGSTEDLTIEGLLAPLEGALSSLWIGMVILAAALLVARL